ncbi:MAG: DNA gyrase modulator, partial [Nitrospirota bacterium]
MPRADLHDWLRTVLKISPADATLAALTQQHSSLTRFANNTIHQNVAETQSHLMVRVEIEARRGLATTTQLTEEGVRSAVDRACELARHSPAVADRPSLPGPQHYPVIARWDGPTAAATPQERGERVARAIRLAANARLMAAGYLATSSATTALADSSGMAASYPSTFAEFALTVMGADSSGWAKAKAPALSELPIEQLTEQAIRTT